MGRLRVIWFFRFLLLGFAVIGVVLIRKGWQLRRLTPAVLRTWTQTTGVVVDVLHRKSLGDSVPRARYFHKLEYTDPSERTHHVWTETSLRHELPRRTVLPLRYAPGNPSRATTLDPDGGGTIPGWGIVVAGAVFFVIGGYGSVLTWV